MGGLASHIWAADAVVGLLISGRGSWWMGQQVEGYMAAAAIMVGIVRIAVPVTVLSVSVIHTEVQLDWRHYR
jgi:hypothetical protein